MKTIASWTLRQWLNDGGELALLDVREAGEFGNGHLLLAVPAPYSAFEAQIARLVPRRTTRIVVYDDGRSDVAERARLRARALGYEDVHVLEGGTEGWERAGYSVFAGVNVPSKVFGELVEHAQHTPTMAASALRHKQLRGDPVVVVDGRPLAEYRRMNIPGSLCCPNGELALRISGLVEDDTTPIVVNCAGRTRSIIGAQTLIDIGVPNPVFALENGTQGWALAGFELERGSDRGYPPIPEARSGDRRTDAIRNLAMAEGVREVAVAEARDWLADPTRTTYVLDVRTPEEFAARPVPNVQNAPGGQLVQATDQWLAVRGARVLLIDHDAIRAPMAARWLRRMGWNAHTLRLTDEATGIGSAPNGTVSFYLPQQPAPLSTADLAVWLRSNACIVLDLRPSMEYRRGHIPDAVWSIRPRIARDVPKGSTRVVLVSDDSLMSRLAAQELAERTNLEVYHLEGGFKRWVAESRPVAASPNVPPDHESIDYLFFVHDRHDGNLAAARKYLEWEQGLVAQLEPDELAIFNP